MEQNDTGVHTNSTLAPASTSTETAPALASRWQIMSGVLYPSGYTGPFDESFGMDHPASFG